MEFFRPALRHESWLKTELLRATAARGDGGHGRPGSRAQGRLQGYAGGGHNKREDGQGNGFD